LRQTKEGERAVVPLALFGLVGFAVTHLPQAQMCHFKEETKMTANHNTSPKTETDDVKPSFDDVIKLAYSLPDSFRKKGAANPIRYATKPKGQQG